MTYAFDANTGKVKWEREAHKGAPFGGRHRKNTFASETPATDGERLYPYFGNVGLFAYSLDGTPLWSTRFDPQPMYLDFGTAASPVVVDGRVFVVHDNEGRSFGAAVDARTGKLLWRSERDIKAPQGSGWSSPFVWATEGADGTEQKELIVVGRQHAISYDPENARCDRGRAVTSRLPRARKATRMWRGSIRAHQPTHHRRSSTADECTW